MPANKKVGVSDIAKHAGVPSAPFQLSQLSGTCLRNAENKDQPRYRRPGYVPETSQQRADPRIQRHAGNRLRG